MNQTLFRRLYSIVIATTAATSVVASAPHVEAALITTSKGTYDVQSFYGSYEANRALLEAQPWYGLDDYGALASEFAMKLAFNEGDVFGNTPPEMNAGPSFVAASGTNWFGDEFYTYWHYYDRGWGYPGYSDGQTRFWTVRANDVMRYYAIAVPSNTTSTPIPTPALLPGLVGMGIAALRKRQQEAEY